MRPSSLLSLLSLLSPFAATACVAGRSELRWLAATAAP